MLVKTYESSQEETPEWVGKPGVYYFHRNGEVLYVGKGTSEWGVGFRIWKHLTEPNWMPELRHPETHASVILFDKALDFYWAAALEECLINQLAPKLNRTGKKKRGVTNSN
jgi:hypothetical protein